MKSGDLNFLEPSGPPQACNGTALSVWLLCKQELNFVQHCAKFSLFKNDEKYQLDAAIMIYYHK
jgi:hypothetical protein